MEAGLTVAQVVGLNWKALREEMNSPEVDVTIQRDIEQLESANVNFATHQFFNGKRVTAMIPSPELLETVSEF